MMVHGDVFHFVERKGTLNTCACICGPSVRTDEGIQIAPEKEVEEGWRSTRVHFLIKYSSFPPELQRNLPSRPWTPHRGTAVSECVFPSVPCVFLQPFGPPSLPGRACLFRLHTRGDFEDECVSEEFSSSSRPSPLLQCCSGIRSLCFAFQLSTVIYIRRHQTLSQQDLRASRGQM